MEFYKLEATGNDFIIIFNDLNINIDVKSICDRNFGVGADGVIIIDESYNIKIYNSDGSNAKMCGNGLRCVCHLINYLTQKDEIGVYIDNNKIDLLENEDNQSTIKMPSPIMIYKDNGYFVTLLNNHFVLLVDDLSKCDFDEHLIEYSIKNKCNVHLVQIINKKNIKMKTYEYGAKITKSCGSGSLAAFFALYMIDKIDNNVNVMQQGGIVNCFCKNNQYYIKGKVNLIYKGDLLNGI